MDKDTDFDNFIATYNIPDINSPKKHPSVQIPITTEMVKNANGSASYLFPMPTHCVQPFNQQTMNTTSFNMMNIPAPIIHNYGQITINYK